MSRVIVIVYYIDIIYHITLDSRNIFRWLPRNHKNKEAAHKPGNIVKTIPCSFQLYMGESTFHTIR